MSLPHYEMQETIPPGGILFSNKKNSDLYWEALVSLGRGDKIGAEKIAEAIKEGHNLLLVAPWKSPHPQYLVDFYDKLFIDYVEWRPETLTSIGLFESIGIREHNAYLDGYLIQDTLDEFAITEKNWHSIKEYPQPKDDFSFLTFYWSLDQRVRGRPFLFHFYPVTQLFGAVQNLTILFTLLHRLEVPEDVTNYISRLEKIPLQFKQVIALMEYQKNHGIVPPRFAIEKSMDMIKGFLETPVEKNLFYTTLAEKADPTDRKRGQTVLAKAVYPSYQELYDYLEKLLKHATVNHGVWALPQGDKYYAHRLEENTTTSYTPQEIHDLGLKEVALIQKKIRSLFKKEGLDDPSKTVGELLSKLANDERFFYPNTDEGREECLKDFAKILERSRKELWPLFNIKPKSEVVVKRVPQNEEKGAPGAYYIAPSLDDSRPGVFYANLRNMKEIPKYRMETLAVHEAEPGHHFQIAIQNELELPLMRKIDGYTAYAEGWALYVEKLAYEKNFYSTSFDRIGHLQDELFRAIRLVVDTGIHYKRWTREEAIAYMQKEMGLDLGNTTTEVERYFVLPGQACSYKIGQLKILELRKKARAKLGKLFKIQEFHDCVLKTSSVPLTVLEKAVDAYIAAKLNKT